MFSPILEETGRQRNTRRPCQDDRQPEIATQLLVLTKHRARFQSLFKWEPRPYPLPSSTMMELDGIRSAILSAYVSRTSISAFVK